MTSIHPKLTAAITTLALLAPAAAAHATTFRTHHPARHFAASQPQRHFTLHHTRRPAVKIHCDSRDI